MVCQLGAGGAAGLSMALYLFAPVSAVVSIPFDAPLLYHSLTYRTPPVVVGMSQQSVAGPSHVLACRSQLAGPSHVLAAGTALARGAGNSNRETDQCHRPLK